MKLALYKYAIIIIIITMSNEYYPYYESRSYCLCNIS